MCGIYGIIQKSRSLDYARDDNSNFSAASEVLTGLKRLEYRGYDSWGIAALSSKIQIEKHVGKISSVQKLDLPKSAIAIGHTRWATHGGVTQKNAHPHLASDKSFALVQNGIVENYDELKEQLKSEDYQFKTETDTEVIVALIEKEMRKEIPWRVAIITAFQKLTGRNTIAVLTHSGEVFAARNGSPLVVGFAGGEIILSSDTLSFAHRAKKILVVENGQLVQIVDGKLKLYEIKSGKQLEYQLENLAVVDDKVDKEGYEHFMIKEIHENPNTIRNVIAQDEDQLQILVKEIKQAKKIYCIGSGTAGIAAAQIAYYLRSISGIEATALVGADCVDYFSFFGKDTVLIVPSQSGETADVLEVLEIAKEKGAKIATYVNMQGSTMSRMADFNFQAQAGPEICVMSTKVFVSQITWGYTLAKAVAGDLLNAKVILNQTAKSIEKYLSSEKNIIAVQKLAQELASAKDIFLLAKGQNLQVAREGMVKLVEASYKHAHAIPAGDLKHYAITIMEEGVPVIVLVSDDSVQNDVLTAAAEVKARGATVIGLAHKQHASFAHYLPVSGNAETVAINIIVTLQLLAYYLTIELGNDVDHPRNIAKSVTVK